MSAPYTPHNTTDTRAHRPGGDWTPRPSKPGAGTGGVCVDQDPLEPHRGRPRTRSAEGLRRGAVQGHHRPLHADRLNCPFTLPRGRAGRVGGPSAANNDRLLGRPDTEPDQALALPSGQPLPPVLLGTEPPAYVQPVHRRPVLHVPDHAPGATRPARAAWCRCQSTGQSGFRSGAIATSRAARCCACSGFWPGPSSLRELACHCPTGRSIIMAVTGAASVPSPILALRVELRWGSGMGVRRDRRRSRSGRCSERGRCRRRRRGGSAWGRGWLCAGGCAGGSSGSV